MAKAPVKAAPPAPALDNVAGFRPDQLIQGGLKADFDGTVTEARYALWDYNGNIDEPVLAVRLTIADDDPDEDDYVQHYSAGDLDHFVPSMDGQAPACDADSFKVADTENPELTVLNPDCVGIYAFKVGTRAGLSNNSNWAQFIGALLEAKPEFVSNLTPDIRCIEGLHGHWDRVPQKKRKGLVQPVAEGQRARNNDILVLTAVTPAPNAPGKKVSPAPPAAASGSSKPAAATSSPTSPASSPASGDLDAKLVEAIVVFGNAQGGTVKKAALAGMVTKTFPQAEKQKAVKRVMDVAFLSDEAYDGVRWSFDADAGEVTVIE